MAGSRSGRSSIVAADREPYALLERVFREEAGRLNASLVRLLGDFDLAEELVAEAVLEALEHWPAAGVPERPTSWLLTTARRKGLDRLRREAVYSKKLELVAALSERPPAEADDRLRLIFTCCHPVLTREAQVALTLRAVVGLTTEEIARAFVVRTETIAKRIVRAKHKIVASRVPYRVPSPDEFGSRLDEVLTVIYLVFNEGYLATAGEVPIRRDLARDAEWLASLLSRLLPAEPEPLGLLALIRLHLARWPARLDAGGRLVLLERQDRYLWDRRAIAQAVRLIEDAAALGRPGRYLIEAMIAALHCEAPTWEATDWPQVLALYTLLAEIDDSPVVALNRAIARRYVEGPAAALADVDDLSDQLHEYHLFHAVRAAILRDLGRGSEAALADAAALALTRNSGERALLAERLADARLP
jgi:RNA polymerase sigma factor (sigma-70 family)